MIISALEEKHFMHNAQAIDIANYLKTEGRLIEQELDRLIPERDDLTKKLFESARYAVLGGGKRLRPILALATAQMLGSDPRLALTPACTLELIHTYSMIHDDLPCMDNDDFRRGKLTVHKKYSEGHAVLTGDFLLTYPFEILATLPSLSAEKKIQLITTLAKQSGSDGMIGGQVIDLAFEGKTISIEHLKLLHRCKTGALLAASIEFGAIIGEAKPKDFIHLKRFGEAIGLAFQIVDDILDVTSSEIKHGKIVSSDIINEKSTYVSLLGLEQAKIDAELFYDQAIKELASLSYDTSLLVGIANYILRREH